MNTLKIEVQPREAGKKEVRALRRAGFVPCVVYGAGEETVSVRMAATDLRPLVFSDQRYRIELQLGETSFDCVLKEVDFNPTTDQPIHADFQMLRAGVVIRLSVPVQFEGKSVGQQEGGEIEFLVHELEVETLPQNIPDHLTVDITNLDIGDTIHVGDLTFGEGVRVVTPAAQSLVTCFHRKVVEEEVAEPEEGLELELGEEGEEVEGDEDEGEGDQTAAE